MFHLFYWQRRICSTCCQALSHSQGPFAFLVLVMAVESNADAWAPSAHTALGWMGGFLLAGWESVPKIYFGEHCLMCPLNSCLSLENVSTKPTKPCLLTIDRANLVWNHLLESSWVFLFFLSLPSFPHPWNKNTNPPFLPGFLICANTKLLGDAFVPCVFTVLSRGGLSVSAGGLYYCSFCSHTNSG